MANKKQQRHVASSDAEKIENLKNLNTLLLTQAKERRLQVEALVKSKASLESQNDSLNFNLISLHKEIADLKGELASKVDHINGLTLQFNAVMTEKEDREKTIAEMITEKGSLEVEFNRLIEVLKRENEEKIRNMEEIKVNEKTELESKERERVEESERMKRRFEGLVEDNDMIEDSLKSALKQVNKLNVKIDEIVGEKVAIQEAKNRLEGEIVILKGEIGALNVAVSAQFKEKTEENMVLCSQVNQAIKEIAQLNCERDEAINELEAEREICVSLRNKIVEMEKTIKEIDQVLSEIKTENRLAHEEKKDLKGENDVLKEKVASLECSLFKDNKDIEDLRAHLLKSEANFGYVLKIVKKVKDGEPKMIDEGGEELGEEIRTCVDDLVAIRSEGESKVEEMKKQVELLNKSVDSHKKKSFWAMLSSATTVFAAASVASAAYMARSH